MRELNLEQAAASLTEYWSPKVIGRVNDQYVKVAKVKGELTWHKHDQEDELFQVLRGSLTIQFEGGRHVTLCAGEFYIVPKGIMHNPVAAEECLLMLVETVTTKHTGDVITPMTRSIDQQLAGTQHNQSHSPD